MGEPSRYEDNLLYNSEFSLQHGLRFQVTSGASDFEQRHVERRIRCGVGENGGMSVANAYRDGSCHDQGGIRNRRLDHAGCRQFHDAYGKRSD